MGKPLPKRTNVVVSRNPSFRADGAIVVRTLEEAIERAREAGDDEAMVIGGAQIYALALPKADRLYFTLIDTEWTATRSFRSSTRRSGTRCAERNMEPMRNIRTRIRYGYSIGSSKSL